MTTKEKKKFLRGYYRAVQKVKALDEELNNLRLNALPGGIDYSKDKVQTTPTNDQLDNYMIRVENVEKKIKNARIDAIDLSVEIIDAISNIDNEIYQTLLHRKYIILQTWDEVARSMGYSVQRVFQLHGKALAELDIEKIREN